MKSGQDRILRFMLRRIYLPDQKLFLSTDSLQNKPLSTSVKQTWKKNVSEGESDLIQIFVFNLRLPVEVGIQRYSVDLKGR